MHIFLLIFILMFWGCSQDPCANPYGGSFYGVKLEDFNRTSKVLIVNDSFFLYQINAGILFIDNNHSFHKTNYTFDYNQNYNFIVDNGFIYLEDNQTLSKINLESNSKEDIRTIPENSISINSSEFVSYDYNRNEVSYFDLRNSIEERYFLPSLIEIASELNISMDNNKSYGFNNCLPFIDNPKEWDKKTHLCMFYEYYEYKHDSINSYNYSNYYIELDYINGEWKIYSLYYFEIDTGKIFNPYFFYQFEFPYSESVKFTNGKTYLAPVDSLEYLEKNGQWMNILDFRENPKVFAMENGRIKLVEFDKIFLDKNRNYKEIIDNLVKRSKYQLFPNITFSENGDIYSISQQKGRCPYDYLTYDYYSSENNSTEPTLTKNIFF